MNASERGHVEIAARHDRRGCARQRAERKGTAALRLAVAAGRLPIVKLLLAHGADPNLRDASSETPLMLAARTDARASPTRS